MSHHQWTLRMFVVSLLFICWLSNALASQYTPRSTSAVGETFLVRVKEDMLSVKIAGSFLADVLGEIAAQSGINLIVLGSREQRISDEFELLPLDEALRRLIKENFFLLYSPNKQLKEVVVLSFGTSFPSPFSLSLPAGQEAAQWVLQPEKGSLDFLIGELKRRDEDRRWEALLELSKLKDERAVEAVTSTLKNDEDLDVRLGAIHGLAELGGQRAVMALVEAASQDSEGFVRQTAVAVLVELEGVKAVEVLKQALRKDPEPLVRYQALVNLAKVGGDHVVGLILEALNDPDELILETAEEILQLQSAGGRNP